MSGFEDFKQQVMEEFVGKQLDEAKRSTEIVYHPSYSAAVQHAEKMANAKGYEVDPNDWFHHVSAGPGKPSEGQTTRHVIPLQKDGKPSKKALAIQVYNRGGEGNNYELNHYIS